MGLNKIETIVSDHNTKDYPEEIRSSIKKALEDIKNNDVVSHAEMKKKYSKYFLK